MIRSIGNIDEDEHHSKFGDYTRWHQILRGKEFGTGTTYKEHQRAGCECWIGALFLLHTTRTRFFRCAGCCILFYFHIFSCSYNMRNTSYNLRHYCCHQRPRSGRGQLFFWSSCSSVPTSALTGWHFKPQVSKPNPGLVYFKTFHNHAPFNPPKKILRKKKQGTQYTQESNTSCAITIWCQTT